MNFIKKYYPMILSILYFVFLTLFVLELVFFEKGYFVFSNFMFINIFASLYILLTIFLIIETIGFIIHAAKSNNGIWALWIYLFGILIMPYYNLKYVIKQEENTIPIIVFVFSIVFLFIICIGVLAVFA